MMPISVPDAELTVIQAELRKAARATEAREIRTRCRDVYVAPRIVRMTSAVQKDLGESTCQQISSA